MEHDDSEGMMKGLGHVEPVAVSVDKFGLAIALPRTTGEALRNVAPATLPILSNISFDMAPGQVVAILGSSGSGKTTLLNALAQRAAKSLQSGSIKFNGLDPKVFESHMAYVQQIDYLMPYLTVRETLRYSAELRLDSGLSRKEKHALVEEVILELGLKDCADTIIGDDWRKGISGGEKRRVSVGCQLLLNPSLIFMDEPTTGLDAFTANNLIETLVMLSRQGRTIFVSIHQPRSDIFKLFDSLILLSKGRLIYAGPGTESMIQYFESLDSAVPEEVNPADFFIDVSSVDVRDEVRETNTHAKVDALITAWEEKCLAKSNGSPTTTDGAPPEMQPLTSSRTAVNPSGDPSNGIEMNCVGSMKTNHTLVSTQIHGINSFSQYLILTRRAWTNLLRDNLAVWGNLLEVILVSVVFGGIFYQLEDTIQGVLSRRSALYIVASIQPYLMLIFVIYKLSNDMKVFDRERADKMYGVVPYLVGDFTAHLPFYIGFPLIYSIITYWMMGFREDDMGLHFWRYALANILAQFNIVTLSYFSISVFRDFASSSLFANSMFTFFLFSTGFFQNLDSIPVYLRWIQKISFLTYEYRLLASNEFSHISYPCAPVSLSCNGDTILAQLAIGVDDYVIPIIGLVALFLGFGVLAAIVLQFKPNEPVKHAGSVVSSISEEDKRQRMQSEAKRTTVPEMTVKLENMRLEIIHKKPTLSGGLFKEERKVLLENISTEFPSKSLTIILGGSGTGKSTLLSLLCARKLRTGNMKSVNQSGKITFNDVPETNPVKIASICSFVRQDDSSLLPALTARETLYFAASLRLPADWTREEKESRAEEIIGTLGLRHCADTIVGNEELKGLSGGEKRRLSIGVQMLTDPSVLVIDEPTSGLDAFTANHIMTTLKHIAEAGRTIICSIHQPRSDIFPIFDNIIVLTRGGRVAYSGPSRKVLNYFGTMGYSMPHHTNPSDFILDICSLDLRNDKSEIESKARVETMVENWRKTHLPFDSLDRLEEGQEREDIKEVVDSKHSSLRRRHAPFSVAFPVLLRRSFLNTRRQPVLVISRVMQVVSLGIIQALFYARQDYAQVSVQNRIGMIQQTLATMFIGLLNCVAVFPSERDILFHERADEAYSVEPFFLAYNLIEIPIELLGAFLYTILTLIVVGMRTTVVTYFCMSFGVFLLINVGESIGIMFCSIVHHVGFSVSMTNAMLGVFVAMSGLLSANMPDILDYINYISPIPYITRLLTINEFDASVTFSCTPEEVSTGRCIYPNGEEVLRKLSSSNSFSYDQFGYFIGIAASLAVIYRATAFVVLKIKAG